MRIATTFLGMVACAFVFGCPTTKIDYFPCPEGKDCTSGDYFPSTASSAEGETGGACTSESDCEGNFCITVTLLMAMGADTTGIDVPNGMCAQFPCENDTSCGASGVCASLAAFTGTDTKICLRPCANLSHCRWDEGYSCMFPFPDDPAFGVCLPDSIIAKVQCPGGTCAF